LLNAKVKWFNLQSPGNWQDFRDLPLLPGDIANYFPSIQASQLQCTENIYLDLFCLTDKKINEQQLINSANARFFLSMAGYLSNVTCINGSWPTQIVLFNILIVVVHFDRSYQY